MIIKSFSALVWGQQFFRATLRPYSIYIEPVNSPLYGCFRGTESCCAVSSHILISMRCQCSLHHLFYTRSAFASIL